MKKHRKKGNILIKVKEIIKDILNIVKEKRYVKHSKNCFLLYFFKYCAFKTYIFSLIQNPLPSLESTPSRNVNVAALGLSSPHITLLAFQFV